MLNHLLEHLRHFTLLFWDFDGVIKESVEVKTAAFVKLFEPCGPEIIEKIRAHHYANGGLSRFAKFPLYLNWVGEESTPERIEELDRNFSTLVLRGVVDAPWVPGAEELIRGNPFEQTFVLVSAAPQMEIQTILSALDLDHYFAAIYGTPTSKAEAIQRSLVAYTVDPSHCLMLGDAVADLEAATVNLVPFLLRRHRTNATVFADYSGPWVEDFTC